MGFWHTGYEEHHQVSSFWNPDEAVDLHVEHKCEQCKKSFQSIDFLIEHRFSAHPYESPVLLIRGKEIGALPININTLLEPKDISVGNVVTAIFNGSQIDLKELGLQLSKVRQQSIDLILSNDELSSRYRINFNISSVEDLAGVENQFLILVKSKELTISSIDKFIEKADFYKSATNYTDGLCEYLYGVLAKEGAKSSSLAPSKYREKFNRSAEQLMDYSSTLANYIKGLIAFHFNHFPEVKKFLNEGNLYSISSFYEQIFSGNDVDIENYATTESKLLENILLDAETNLILRAFRNANPSRADLIALDKESQSDKVSDFGKVKIKILMIKLFLKSKIEKQAIPILKELNGFSNLEPWTNQVIKKIELAR
jgi:hypothetical protein